MSGPMSGLRNVCGFDAPERWKCAVTVTVIVSCNSNLRPESAVVDTLHKPT
jgi:hypothetical protein